MLRSHVVLLVCLATATASAQPPPDRAAQLFEEGRELARSGRHAEACARFAASYELDRATGTKLNLGDCHEQLGELTEAWRWFAEAARDFEKTGDKRAEFARTRAGALDQRLGKVVVRLADPTVGGLAVSIGGRNVQAAAEILERFAPGDVEVRVSAPGRTTFVRSATVTAGATATIDVPAFDASVPREATDGRRRGRIVTAYVVGGTGALGLAATGVLVLVSRSKYRGAISSGHCVEYPDRLDCDDVGVTRTEDAIMLANIATITSIASLALIAGAATIYATAPRTAVVVSPAVGDGGVGLAVGGRF